jgi:hypothetical protein
MRKCCLAACLLILLVNVAYSQNKKLQAGKIKNPNITYVSAQRIRRYPFPVVNFEREGLARKGDQKEIMERIVYPVINKSKKPIAAIIVTFYADEPHITVLVLWHGEEFRGVLIERNAEGHFDADAYKVFFEEIEV